jgi:hypothetical protein
MAKSKLGKNVDDIFGPTSKKAPESPPKTASRSVEASESVNSEIVRQETVTVEPLTRTTVMLPDTQIHWLDRLSSDIRLKNRAAINRSDLIRSIIAALQDSQIDLSSVSSVLDIRKLLLARIK